MCDTHCWPDWTRLSDHTLSFRDAYLTRQMALMGTAETDGIEEGWTELCTGHLEAASGYMFRECVEGCESVCWCDFSTYLHRDSGMRSCSER